MNLSVRVRTIDRGGRAAGPTASRTALRTVLPEHGVRGSRAGRERCGGAQ